MPKPFVPADCDVRRMPYMLLDVNRLLQSDLFLTAPPAVFKAAFTLWLQSWLQVPASSLPNSSTILAKLAQVDERTWRKNSAKYLHGFVLCDDGRYYHPVIAEKALLAWAKSAAGKKANAIRWQSDRTSDRTPTGYPIEVKRSKDNTNPGSNHHGVDTSPVDNSQPNPKPGGNESRKPEPPKLPANWQHIDIEGSNPRLEQAAHALGCWPARPGETWVALRARCYAKLEALHKGTP